LIGLALRDLLLVVGHAADGLLRFALQLVHLGRQLVRSTHWDHPSLCRSPLSQRVTPGSRGLPATRICAKVMPGGSDAYSLPILPSRLSRASVIVSACLPPVTLFARPATPSRILSLICLACSLFSTSSILS